MTEKNSFSTVEQALDAIARGEVIIVVDAEDRENEGDFICAADKATPQTINFMLHGRGQLCVSILPETAERCALKPLVSHNNAPLSTAFLTPVDHRTTRTGITAQERSKTIRELARATSSAGDFVRPGHVFPLLAKKGGVLQRDGHTEAAMDLARLAGLAPAGVLCEILGENGERPSRQYLFELAELHQLKIISIAQLVEYRRAKEMLVQRVAEAFLPTRYGPLKIIAYDVLFDSQQPIALVMGDPASATAPLVRMHSSCFTGDILASLRCDCGDQLNLALDMISHEGQGVVVYLPHEGRGIGLVDKIRAYALQDLGLDTVEANLALGYEADERNYSTGIQILEELGLKRIRLLTNNPQKTEAIALADTGLEVVDQVPLLPPIHQHSRNYMNTKREKMGHLLSVA